MTDTGSIFSGDLSITQGLEQLRMRLLDLTGRNRLLNFRHTAGRSLQFVSCNPEAVYQRLVVATGGQKVTISAVPEPKADQWIEKNGRLSPPDARQHAESLGINTAYDIPSELALPALEEKGQQARALYYPDDLGKHCRKLEREAKSAIEETGANMLYLVFGFLEFPDTKDSDKPFHAPLVSVPVRFEGSSDGRYVTYKIAYTGEEVDENLSLREKIKRDYQINLPPFPEDLESVEDYFSAIAKVIKPLPKWRLRRMVSLALLSFANMLLVRDLEPQRWTLGGKKSLLLEHDLVKRVFSGAPEGSPIEYASEYEVDNHQHADLNIIYDADSSQHSALIDVLNGRSMVIEGPPGTGKSQTITNIIASCLQAGKSVLFVSEKLAALQVVKSNLSRVGLDPFLLELHSNKTSKKAVLDDISSRIAFRPRTPPGIEDTEAALKAKKRELKEHSALLNSVVGNKMGCTVHQVLWRAERHRIELGEVANASLDITFEPAPHTTAGEYNVLADQMGYLASHHEEIGSFSNTHPFWGFYPTRLQPGDDLSVGRLFDDVVPTLLHLEQQLRDLEAIVGIEGHSLLSMKASTESLNKLKSLASKLDANAAHELLPRIFFASSPRTQRAIELVSYAEALFDGIAHLKARIAGRIVDSRVGPETAKNIGEHENTIASVGLLELNTAKLRTHVAELRQAAEHAIAGLAMIRQLSSDIGLPTDDSRTGIQRFETILNESEHAPDRSLRFRHPGLNDPDARETIKKALTDKTRLFAKEQSLSSMLYLDNPVPDDALRESITALRQGSAWYRIFQKRWRQAIRFHRDLRRDKSKLSPETRLAELEDLNLFQKTKRDWHANESVKAACGPHYRGEDSPFADLLQISSWMLQAHDRLAAAGIPTALFDPSTIDAQHLAKLRTVRSEAKQSLEAISSIFSLPKRIFKLQPQQLSELAATPNMSAYIQRVVDTAASIESAATFFAQYTSADIPVVESATALRDTIELHSKKELSMAPDLVALFGDRLENLPDHLPAIKSAIAYGNAVIAESLPAQVNGVLLQPNAPSTIADLKDRLSAVVSLSANYAEFELSMSKFGEFRREEWGDAAQRVPSKFVHTLHERTAAAATQLDQLMQWGQYVQCRSESLSLGLDRFVGLLETGTIAPSNLPPTFAFRFYTSVAQSIFNQHRALSRFSGIRHSKLRDEYAQLDRQLIGMRGKQIAARCVKASAPPEGHNGARVDDKTEMNLINLLVTQTRPRVTVRKMLARAGRAIQALKPCFMMGPQAVAQFLEPGSLKFDIVVMDEASQLRPEEAIGAIARGSQLVVVGDPKQLPPTSFFSRGTTNEDDQTALAVVDSESILDVAITHFNPVRSLRWHYRSRHHSLIAFSNLEFYGGKLIVFPSPYPKGKRLGVRYHYVRDALYEDQLNPEEAKRVVDQVVDHITTTPDLSLGIVTLNTRQRDLIEELLLERLKSVTGAEKFQEKWEAAGYRLFVKNLENVQGDERDTIIISTTFGKAPGVSKPRQNFGPISRDGGWRRLNVLFTRARSSVVLISSLRPEDIIVDHRTPRGTQAFRNYLEYACYGKLRHVQEEPTEKEPDSDFEVSVIEVLKAAGYETTPQLGVAGFRIDIGVKHPDHPASYLAGIECDGASYHSGVSVRDRDRIRQEILESIGWKGRLWRIWSTDWFRNPKAETAKLLSFLRDRRSESVDLSFVTYLSDENARVVDSAEQPTVVERRESDATVESVLLTEATEQEIEVGDLVSYIDVDRDSASQILVRITERTQDINTGSISQQTPLAQVLLGATVGETVVLRVPGQPPRPLEIKQIKKARAPQTNNEAELI